MEDIEALAPLCPEYLARVQELARQRADQLGFKGLDANAVRGVQSMIEANREGRLYSLLPSNNKRRMEMIAGVAAVLEAKARSALASRHQENAA